MTPSSFPAAGPESDFPTPTLEAESAALLHEVSSHGGYVFARIVSQAASSPAAAEAAREMAWEQLHSGPWNSVLPVWRDAYSLSCLHVARFHFRRRECREALRVLDMGILMGGPLLRPDLDAAVRLVSDSSREDDERYRNADGVGRRLVEGMDIERAEVGRLLPVNSLTCKVVEKLPRLSMEGFLREHFLPGRPVVISECMGHWPALSKWNDVDYLNRVAGDRTVPVEVGKNYLCQEWKQELITFSEFLERIRSNDSSSTGPTYLAQHQLFDQINELRKDICVPDYCFAGDGELRSLNAWFGPSGTVTPLHHDPHHNILAQVVGKKYIRLYSSSYTEEIYPHSETMLSNSSQVDLDNIDESEFPKMLDLDFLDCILEEGEMLYIPPKWWHYVRSLTPSLSVSFWWSDSDSANS